MGVLRFTVTILRLARLVEHVGVAQVCVLDFTEVGKQLGEDWTSDGRRQVSYEELLVLLTLVDTKVLIFGKEGPDLDFSTAKMELLRAEKRYFGLEGLNE